MRISGMWFMGVFDQTLYNDKVDCCRDILSGTLALSE